MPVIPLIARETTYTRSLDPMCCHESRAAEEETAAEESFTVYCKPVELYNILQRRAIINPSFLHRCLQYKLQVKHKRRIQVTVSPLGTVNDGVAAQSIFPLYVLLARSVGTESTEHSATYQFNRAHLLSTCAGNESMTLANARFILPAMDHRLSVELKSGSLVILLISYGSSLSAVNLIKDHKDMASSSFLTSSNMLVTANAGAKCFLGKITMESLYSSWQKTPNFSIGESAALMLSIKMQGCFTKLSCLEEGKLITFQFPSNDEATNTSLHIPVIISAEEVGAKDISPYTSYTNDSSSLPQIIRLRAGNVIFNYRYHNNTMQRTEVTEDFSCPFCLVKCASFKGLSCHLSSSHNLFSFEFRVTEEYQAVNVSVKNDLWRPENVADGVDPKQQTFFFCSKPLRRRKPKSLVQNANHVHPWVLDPRLPLATNESRDRIDRAQDFVERDRDSHNTPGVSGSTAYSFVSTEGVQSVHGSNITPPAMLQFAKTRKLSLEQSDVRNRTLLRNRQFFHSHRAQPMAVEQVLSDRDSEDEVDDDVADFEDRRMLDDFVDVTKDEKHMMHLWNSFVRKQRVLADGHIPWACEAFSRLHGHGFVQTPALLWCWRIFMIKLWNHGLLDAKTMNSCNIILEQCQKQDADSMKS